MPLKETKITNTYNGTQDQSQTQANNKHVKAM